MVKHPEKIISAVARIFAANRGGNRIPKDDFVGFHTPCGCNRFEARANDEEKGLKIGRRNEIATSTTTIQAKTKIIQGSDEAYRQESTPATAHPHS
jgi:hypothetical protein